MHCTKKSFQCIEALYYVDLLYKCDAPGGTRTPNQLIRSWLEVHPPLTFVSIVSTQLG